MKNQTSTNLIIRSSLALALTMAIWSPIKALSAKPADENMMNHTDGGNMMNHTYGWMGGWMWVWTVAGILVVVLLVAVIIKLFKE